MVIGRHLFLVLAAVSFLIELIGPSMKGNLLALGLLLLTLAFLF